MAEDHVCTMYCEGDIHAFLLTARAGVMLAAFERWAECFGYVLHDVRRVIEVDLSTEQAKRKWHWDPVTWTETPYDLTDALPTDEVWMVRVSVSEPWVSGAESAPVREETGYPRPGWAWGMCGGNACCGGEGSRDGGATQDAAWSGGIESGPSAFSTDALQERRAHCDGKDRLHYPGAGECRAATHVYRQQRP